MATNQALLPSQCTDVQCEWRTGYRLVAIGRWSIDGSHPNRQMGWAFLLATLGVLFPILAPSVPLPAENVVPWGWPLGLRRAVPKLQSAGHMSVHPTAQRASSVPRELLAASGLQHKAGSEQSISRH